MDGMIIRQGTIYEHRTSARRLLVINHNPMQLESLLLTAAAPDAPLDLDSLQVVAIDELISLRRSGEYRDLGDLPSDGFQRLLRALLSAPELSEDLRTLLEALAE